jgi:hypothetical protein
MLIMAVLLPPLNLDIENKEYMKSCGLCVIFKMKVYIFL